MHETMLLDHMLAGVSSEWTSKSWNQYEPRIFTYSQNQLKQ